MFTVCKTFLGLYTYNVSNPQNNPGIWISSPFYKYEGFRSLINLSKIAYMIVIRTYTTLILKPILSFLFQDYMLKIKFEKYGKERENKNCNNFFIKVYFLSLGILFLLMSLCPPVITPTPSTLPFKIIKLSILSIFSVIKNFFMNIDIL